MSASGYMAALEPITAPQTPITPETTREVDGEPADTRQPITLAAAVALIGVLVAGAGVTGLSSLFAGSGSATAALMIVMVIGGAFGAAGFFLSRQGTVGKPAGTAAITIGLWLEAAALMVFLVGISPMLFFVPMAGVAVASWALSNNAVFAGRPFLLGNAAVAGWLCLVPAAVVFSGSASNSSGGYGDFASQVALRSLAASVVSLGLGVAYLLVARRYESVGRAAAAKAMLAVAVASAIFGASGLMAQQPFIGGIIGAAFAGVVLLFGTERGRRGTIAWGVCGVAVSLLTMLSGIARSSVVIGAALMMILGGGLVAAALTVLRRQLIPTVVPMTGDHL
jgi:hypothetical protein